jgi:hypothetical protein
MPFPYVGAETFRRESEYTPSDFPGIASESDWQALIDEALRTASERVADYANLVTTDAEWDPDDKTVPFVAREATIRLARARIARIKEDGLESEGLASGVNYSYRPPATLREEVQESLDEAGYRAGDDDFVFNA